MKEPVEAESLASIFETAQVIGLGPNDVLIFRSPRILEATTRERVVEMLNEVFPDHESIILEGGQDIAVLRPQQGPLGRIWRRLRGVE